MKNFLYILFAIAVVAGCKPDDSDAEPTIEDCCSNRGYFNTASNFTLYIPSAFTPNGDGLNDLFRIYFSETYGISSLVDVKLHDENNTLLFAIDTMYPIDINGNGHWKMKDSQGDEVYGNLKLDLVVMDTAGSSTAISTTIYSYDCTTLGGNAAFKSFKNCVYEDQLKLGEGFIYPTAETTCN